MASKEAVIYVTRDIERAMGMAPSLNYYIVTNKTQYSEEMYNLYPKHIFLVDSKEILSTYELLNHKEVLKFISQFDSKIVVFKNTKQIEELCKIQNLTLLNPDAALAEKIENKISQVKWLGNLSSLLPKYEILQTKDIDWKKEVFILQWAHGHTGDGTILVQNEEALNNLKEKFPNREAKITPYIKGPMFTLNIVASKEKIFSGNISYQITGILPFTENIFSTIGNDWSIPHSILTESKIEELKKIAHLVGEKMREDGWKGLFGIDVIYDEERDTLSLIEINARQPASTTFESELENNLRDQGISGLTIFETHILALLDQKIEGEIIPINDGAQIVQRITSVKKEIDENKIIDAGYNVIKYNNPKINSDLLRIQSKKGILEAHTKFNKRGKEIIELLS
jgi:predicted ATP-grasp superfamily ATP-dependent carboligase